LTAQLTDRDNARDGADDPDRMSGDAAADGRRLRREANVDAVIEATLDLMAEGQVQPGAAAIAERAGISMRSLFRYFEDLDELALIAVERQAERADDLFVAIDGTGSLDGRITRLVEHRLALHRRIGGVLRAGRARAHQHPAIAAALARRRLQLRRQLEHLFAGELAAAGPQRGDVLAALEVLTGPEALDALRVDRRMSAARAGAAVHRGVTALLTPLAR
jgi:AcrR family transcriptional regulator